MKRTAESSKLLASLLKSLESFYAVGPLPKAGNGNQIIIRASASVSKTSCIRNLCFLLNIMILLVSNRLINEKIDLDEFSQRKYSTVHSNIPRTPLSTKKKNKSLLRSHDLLPKNKLVSFKSYWITLRTIKIPLRT